VDIFGIMASEQTSDKVQQNLILDLASPRIRGEVARLFAIEDLSS
jgi:hypothetical protein